MSRSEVSDAEEALSTYALASTDEPSGAVISSGPQLHCSIRLHQSGGLGSLLSIHPRGLTVLRLNVEESMVWSLTDFTLVA